MNNAEQILREIVARLSNGKPEWTARDLVNAANDHAPDLLTLCQDARFFLNMECGLN